VLGDVLDKLIGAQEQRRKALIIRMAKFTKFKVIGTAHLVNNAPKVADKTDVDFSAPEICCLMPIVMTEEVIKGEPEEAVHKLS
jgi:hypothetical protein